MSFVIIFDLILILIHAGEKKIVCIMYMQQRVFAKIGKWVGRICVEMYTYKNNNSYFIFMHTYTNETTRRNASRGVFWLLSQHIHTHTYTKERHSQTTIIICTATITKSSFLHTQTKYMKTLSIVPGRVSVCSRVFESISIGYFIYIYFICTFYT